jgi:hypothetical protein
MQLLIERIRDTKLWAQSDKASKLRQLVLIGFHRLNSRANQHNFETGCNSPTAPLIKLARR